MPMKLFAQYLKQRWRGIAVAILFCLIFAVTFALYHLPIEAVLYPASICGALGLMLLGIDFRRVLTKHKKLERIRTITDAISESFPKVEGMEDADYQQIIQLLADEQAQFHTAMNQRYEDMVAYELSSEMRNLWSVRVDESGRVADIIQWMEP